ncbi:hypothetical protein VBY74_13510 [Tenacibaculum ascidiaceicola]|uniref:hypothetical protein n=1 Tax=Tenacibaculum ascidiaceicola TaxID=1699411 RepID=UPI0039EC4D4C
MALFVYATEGEEDRQNGLQLDIVVLVCGLLTLSWIILLTYIAYELNLSFIRGSITIILIRALFWFIYAVISNRKKIVHKLDNQTFQVHTFFITLKGYEKIVRIPSFSFFVMCYYWNHTPILHANLAI